MAGNTGSARVQTSTTVAELRLHAGEALKIKKSHAKKLSLSVNGEILTSGRKIWSNVGIGDASTVSVSTGLSGGGGKRAREGAKEDLATLMDFNIATPEEKESDTTFIRNAFKIQNVDIEEWLKSLPNTKVEELMKKLDDNDGKKTSLKYIVAPFLDFITEHKSLEETKGLMSRRTMWSVPRWL